MSAPKRIQLRRTKGWRKPEGAIVVARPTRWGNPFVIGEPIPLPDDVTPLRSPDPTCVEALEHLRPDLTVLSAEHAVELFRAHVGMWPGYAQRARLELAGHDLACWCWPDLPCHADVLLAISNASDGAA